MKGLAQLCRCACTITCRKPYIYPDLPNVPPRKTLIADLFLKFLLDRGSFCGATGTLCFGLQMTLLPMGKVIMDPSLLAGTLLLLVLNDSQSHIWLLGPGTKPRSLTPEASTILLRQPDPEKIADHRWAMYPCC